MLRVNVIVCLQNNDNHHHLYVASTSLVLSGVHITSTYFDVGYVDERRFRPALQETHQTNHSR